MVTVGLLFAGVAPAYAADPPEQVYCSSHYSGKQDQIDSCKVGATGGDCSAYISDGNQNNTSKRQACDAGKTAKNNGEIDSSKLYCETQYAGKQDELTACKAGRDGGDCAAYAAPATGTQTATEKSKSQACESGKREKEKADNGGVSQTIGADGGECGGAKTVIITCNGQKGEQAIGDLLKQFVLILSLGVGIVATGAIIFGAILYSSARDNASQTQQAIGVIRNAVIGIILYIFMVAIVNWLVPGGVIT